MSANKIEVRGLVINNDIRFSSQSWEEITMFLGLWDGREITVTYDATDSRSKRQNSFFHAVVIPVTQRVLREQGHPKWTSLEYIKEVILKKPFLTVNVGTEDEYVRHTSDLNIGEMWKFINQCLMLIADCGGQLRPEEYQKYLDIVKKYKLEDSIDQAIEKDL